MTSRTHFVYRVYDEFGLLLYVGCSKNHENRRKQHASDKAPWLPFMASARLEGPYEKSKAFAQERSVIATEAPFFNSSAEHIANNAQRRKVRKRLMDEARTLEPDVFDGMRSRPTQDDFDEFHALIQVVNAHTEAEVPEMGSAYRLNQYLSARRLELVKAA